MQATAARHVPPLADGATPDGSVRRLPAPWQATFEHAIALARAKPAGTAAGALLRDFALLLAAELTQAGPADRRRLDAATRAMGLLAATAPDSASAAEADEHARLRRLVRDHIGAATLGPARLCRLAGISRSQLYRVFAPDGGVAAHIQRQRLAAAHDALRDPADARSIGAIAAAVGLFDASSFSRMFRRAFGCTPSAVRQATALIVVTPESARDLPADPACFRWRPAPPRRVPPSPP